MVLHILTAAKGGSCTVIKTGCYVSIPNYSKNITEAKKDLNKHVTVTNALDLDLSAAD